MPLTLVPVTPSSSTIEQLEEEFREVSSAPRYNTGEERILSDCRAFYNLVVARVEIVSRRTENRSSFKKRDCWGMSRPVEAVDRDANCLSEPERRYCTGLAFHAEAQQKHAPLFELFEDHSRTAASKSFSNSAGIRWRVSSLERRRDAIDAACASGERIDSRA